MSVGIAGAQRYAVIDSKFIPEKRFPIIKMRSQTGPVQCDVQQEIDQKQAALDKMVKDYEVEQGDAYRRPEKKREDELYNKEKELRDLQKKILVFEGDLFERNEWNWSNLVQDKVYNAIQKLALKKQYDFILDKVKELLLSLPTPNSIRARMWGRGGVLNKMVIRVRTQ